jgi:hypothetical protein
MIVLLLLLGCLFFLLNKNANYLWNRALFARLPFFVNLSLHNNSLLFFQNNITEGPRFKTRVKSESIKKKEAIELSCSAFGDSKINIKWIKENKVIQDKDGKFR